MGRTEKKNKRLIFVSRLLFIVYMLCVLYFLLVSEGFGRTTGDCYKYNLTLFTEINRFYGLLGSSMNMKAIINLFGNVVCFVPFGLFIPYIFNRRLSFFRVLFITFLFSLTIEGIQLYFKIGIFDVDDLLLNTLGGIAGYLIYKIVSIIRNH